MSKFNKLSRAEMKNVVGGVLSGCACKNVCNSDDDCPGNSYCEKQITTCMGASPGCSYNDCVGQI